jgi:hypothetical protein
MDLERAVGHRHRVVPHLGSACLMVGMPTERAPRAWQAPPDVGLARAEQNRSARPATRWVRRAMPIFNATIDFEYRYIAPRGVPSLGREEVVRLAIAGAPVPQIATFTGHSLRHVEAILDAHYLGRDIQLAEAAVLKLEQRTKL